MKMLNLLLDFILITFYSSEISIGTGLNITKN